MSKKRIESIELQDIGVFKNVTIEFPEAKAEGKAEIHIFTGMNGCGKTTLLEALVALSGGNAPNLMHKMSGKQEFVGVLNNKKYDVWPRRNRDGTEKLKRRQIPTSDKVEETKVAYETNSYNSKLDFAAFVYSGNRNLLRQKLFEIDNTAISPLYQALEFNANTNYNTGDRTLQWIGQAITKKALAFMNGKAQKAEEYGAIIKKIEQILSEITAQSITFEMQDNPVQVVLKQNNIVTTFDALSDGLKSLISWIADLLLRLEQTPWVNDIPVLERNFILFLDEIAVHLHPELQRKILPIVQDLFPNAQIFLTTHSPFVVGSVSDAWVYELELENGVTTIGQPVPSKAGQSINAILKDVFDVEERFDVETERLLDQFYDFRQQLLLNAPIDKEVFDHLIATLSNKGEEINNIIQRELRQLQRRGQL